MDIKKACSIYFSPTGTTQKAVTAFTEGLGKPYEKFDLTTPGARQSFKHSFSKDELLVAGMPVYGGRLPMRLDDFFTGLKGNGAPAAAIVVYGNREYEDALLELKMRLKDKGFQVIAGAAFIGEHTFSSKIATGRPDAEDLDTAGEYGKKSIKAICQGISSQLNVKGNFPFVAKGFNPSLPGGPLSTYGIIGTTEYCIHCGACVEQCPWGAISYDAVYTNYAECMRCFRCVKICPASARKVIEPKFFESLPDFEKRLTAHRKEPELFLPG